MRLQRYHWWRGVVVCRYVWLDKNAPVAFLPISTLVLMGYGLNLYWFVGIVNALLRAVRRSSALEKSEKKESWYRKSIQMHFLRPWNRILISFFVAAGSACERKHPHYYNSVFRSTGFQVIIEGEGASWWCLQCFHRGNITFTRVTWCPGGFAPDPFSLGLGQSVYSSIYVWYIDPHIPSPWCACHYSSWHTVIYPCEICIWQNK